MDLRLLSCDGRSAAQAGAAPDVRMNPLLLKPESDTHSQVVLLGQVDDELSRVPWHERGERVWPVIAGALDALRAENDVVVIGGRAHPGQRVRGPGRLHRPGVPACLSG
jgi:adenosylcobyric acid synthase